MTIKTFEIETVLMIESYEHPLTQMKGGDLAAFRLIFEQNKRLVGGFIFGMTGDVELTEELTQETFVRAFENIGYLQDETKLSTWLCGIAKNIVFNLFRSRESAKQKIKTIKQNSANYSPPMISPETEILNNELNQKIHQALQKLNENRRTVFTLKVIQQLSYAEIAEITGFSIPKLKTDLHRAKAEMREMIRPYLEDNYEL